MRVGDESQRGEQADGSGVAVSAACDGTLGLWMRALAQGSAEFGPRHAHVFEQMIIEDVRSRISPCRRQASAIMRTDQPANWASSCHQGNEDEETSVAACCTGNAVRSMYRRVVGAPGEGLAHISWR